MNLWELQYLWFHARLNQRKETNQQNTTAKPILNNIKNCYKKGITNVEALKETAYSFLNEHHELEYLEFMNESNLEEVQTANENTRVFIACKVGGVRLIDNILLGE